MEGKLEFIYDLKTDCDIRKYLKLGNKKKKDR